MRTLIFALLFTFTVGAQAETSEDKWANEIAAFELGLEDRSQLNLYFSIVGYGAKTVVGCSAGSALAVATVVADTFPVTGFSSEIVANLADPDYQTVEDFWSWQTLLDSGRGTSGGAAVATVEAVEFMFLWLFGDEERSFQATKKVYESSYITFKEVFAEDAACLGNAAKTALLYAEFQKRWEDNKNYVEQAPKLVQP